MLQSYKFSYFLIVVLVLYMLEKKPIVYVTAKILVNIFGYKLKILFNYFSIRV